MLRSLFALVLVLWPAAPARADIAWPDGIDPDSVRAATVGAATIAAGRAHSCAVTSVGTLYCWGNDSDGQLGDGDPLTPVTRAVAVQMGEMAIAVQVDAGEEHTCALEYRGGVYCWGDNSSGQLGVGDTTDRHAPATTKFSDREPPYVLVEVTTGENHSCAIDEDGAAWCWGSGSKGQLGLGGAADADHPVRVSGATGLTDPVVDIAAGGDTTCAATADGVVWCWGAGDRGQLGNGGLVDADRPVRVNGGGVVRQIAVGKQESCAVDEDGRAWCWGRTASGVETLPAAQGGPDFTQVAVGGEHVCGLDTGGASWCWGSGGEGQLGTGGTADAASPQRVVRDSDIGVRDLDTGDEHTCALDARYVAHCWGNGGAGRLGTGAARVPGKVLALPRAPAAVSAVRVKPIDRGLRVTWRPAADFGSGHFVSYLAVTSDFGAYCEVGAPTGTSCDLTGLANGADYDVTVLTYATEGTTISVFATAAPGPPIPNAIPTGIAPVDLPHQKGDLPSTGGEPVVWSTVALGFLLIGLGLTALMVKRAR